MSDSSYAKMRDTLFHDDNLILRAKDENIPNTEEELDFQDIKTRRYCYSTNILFIAIIQNKNEGYIKKLIDLEVNMYHQNSKGDTPMSCAIQMSNKCAIKVMIDSGYDLNKIIYLDLCALGYAITIQKSIDVVNLFLAQKIDIDICILTYDTYCIDIHNNVTENNNQDATCGLYHDCLLNVIEQNIVPEQPVPPTQYYYYLRILLSLYSYGYEKQLINVLYLSDKYEYYYDEVIDVMNDKLLYKTDISKEYKKYFDILTSILHNKHADKRDVLSENELIYSINKKIKTNSIKIVVSHLLLPRLMTIYSAIYKKQDECCYLSILPPEVIKMHLTPYLVYVVLVEIDEL